MLQKFAKLSEAKKLLIFLLVFVVIGGGYMAYKSFAAVPIKVKGEAYLIQTENDLARAPDLSKIPESSPKSKKVLQIKTEKKNYYVQLDDSNNLDIEPGSTVEVTGYLASEESGIIEASPEEIFSATQTSRAPSQRKILPDQNNIRVAAILVNVCKSASDCPNINDRVTKAQVEKVLVGDPNQQTVRDFYRESSYGKTNFSANVYGVYNVVLPSFYSTCDIWGLHETIDGIVSKDINLSQYTNVSYVLLNNVKCAGSTTGWGYYFMPYNFILNSATNSNAIDNGYLVTTLTHELGHNFGLLHANASLCFQNNVKRHTYSTQVAISNNCKPLEYYDFSDYMGFSGTLAPLNGIHRSQLGYIPEDKIITINKSGQYTISRLDVANISDSKGLPFIARIKRANQKSTEGSDFYDLEFMDLERSVGTKWAKPLGDKAGLLIRKKSSQSTHWPGFPAHPPQQLSLLLDANPGEPKEKGTFWLSDSALQVGQTFNDNESNIKITTVSINSNNSITFNVDLSKK